MDNWGCKKKYWGCLKGWLHLALYYVDRLNATDCEDRKPFDIGI